MEEVVIADLKADLIGVQEINDRAALEAVFDASVWGLIIDDDSIDNQDLAIAFRKSKFKPIGIDSDLDADDSHFLFPSGSEDTFWINRRDCLVIEFEYLPNGKRLNFGSVHQKARSGGRNTTQFKRVGAARLLESAIESKFDGKPLALVGDWNDNPDDISLNILETGDPHIGFGDLPTSSPVLMVNLMQPLCNAGFVSHGFGSVDPSSGKINTFNPNSRDKNKNLLGTDQHTGPILFDQILVTPELNTLLIPSSTKIFDGGVAGQGSGATMASDHLPVFARFNLDGVSPCDGSDGDGGSQPIDPTQLKIATLLPNPTGDDPGKEEVEIRNSATAPTDLSGWSLVDRGQNSFGLTGTILPNTVLKFVLPSGSMPLNNNGDEVRLFNASGQEIHKVSYQAGQATVGVRISF